MLTPHELQSFAYEWPSAFVQRICRSANVTLPLKKNPTFKVGEKSWLEHQAICLAITFDILGRANCKG